MATESYADIAPGRTLRSRTYVLSEQEIIDFAAQWNPEPFHVDNAVARANGFEGVFASGVHLLSISVKLGNELDPRPEFIAGLGWDEILFHKAVYPGDRLVLEQVCVEKRRSGSRPDAGIVKYRMALINQADECVVSYLVTAMMACND